LLVEGLVVLFVVIALPKGLGGIALTLPRFARRGAAADPAKASAVEAGPHG
jgi:hypothetical protein